MKTLSLPQFAMRLMCGLLAVACVSSFAADKKLPEGKSVLKPGGIKASDLHVGPDNKFGEMTIIEVKDQPFKEAIHAVVKEKPNDPWIVQVNTMSAESVKQGDVVLASFYVRTIASKNEGGKGAFSVYFGIPEGGVDPTITQEITVGKEWTKIQIPGTVAADYPGGKSMLNLDIGLEPQTLEFGEIKLINYGSKVPLSDLPSSGF